MEPGKDVYKKKTKRGEILDGSQTDGPRRQSEKVKELCVDGVQDVIVTEPHPQVSVWCLVKVTDTRFDQWRNRKKTF